MLIAGKVNYDIVHTSNNGPVAQRTRRLTTDQEIAGSNPAGIEFFVRFFFLLFCSLLLLVVVVVVVYICKLIIYFFKMRVNNFAGVSLLRSIPSKHNIATTLSGRQQDIVT